MSFFKRMVFAVVALSFIGSLAACQDGPMERAGEKADKAVENTKDTVKDATH
jgi:uncharacterized lipoprotein YehR (DUF1307 family)